ncbi:MAG: alanine racemase [Lacisediminihabitans sp.]
MPRSSLFPTVDGPRAVIDLDAIRHNVGVLRSAAGTAKVMAIVKADGYGHGAAAVALAALEAGAAEIGVATIPEALALRTEGVTAPLIAWLHHPGTDFGGAMDADVTLGVSSLDQLADIRTAARERGIRARVDLKLDTGLNRNGCPVADWPVFFDEVARAVAEGELHVRGVFSHLACADDPESTVTSGQLAVFREGIAALESRGIAPQLRHLANSAATLTRPDTHFDMVRAGIAIYGLSPITGQDFGLIPALSLVAPVALVKRVAAGEGVSYGHTWIAPEATTVALIPLGYADGIPRALSGRFDVAIDGTRYPAVGRVCMDQFMVNLGDDARVADPSGGHRPIQAGDDAVIIGGATDGLTEWAERLGTIHYELATGIHGRIERVYLGL